MTAIGTDPRSGGLPLSLTVGLVLAVAALVLPLVAARVAASAARDGVEDDVHDGQLAAVTAVVTNLERSHETAVRTVARRAETPGLAAAVGASDAATLARLVDTLSEHDALRRLVAYDAAGAPLATAPLQPDLPGAIDPASDLSVSDPELGPGGTVVTVRAPIREAGQVVGILEAAVGFRELVGGPSALRLPGGLDVTIVDDGGTILASPQGASEEGQRLQATEARSLIASGRNGGAQYRSERYGYDVVATFAAGSDHPWGALALSPASEVFATAERLEDRMLLGGVVLAAVTLVAGLCVAAYVGSAERRLRAAEQAAVESEERRRLTYEHAPVGMATVAPDGRFLEVNSALCTILGRERGELLGLTVQEITHPDDLEADLARARELLEDTRESYVLEKRYLRPDGEVVWAQLHGTLLREHEGQPPSFLGGVEDITARKQAEAQLRMQEEIVHAMTDGVALSRVSDGRIIFTNPQFDAMYGYARGELLGQRFAVVNAGGDPRHLPGADEALRRLASGGVWSGEVESLRKDGTTFWRHSRVSQFDLRDVGAVVVSVHTDVTERRRVSTQLAEQAAELARSNADLEDFAAIAAHDLKAPLTAIGGFASLLESGQAGPLSDDGNEYAGYITAGVDRMRQLVDDLLAYAHVGTTATLEQVPLDEILRDVALVLGARFDESGGRLVADGLPAVRGDAGQLRQLFTNLIDNALKFRSPERSPLVDVTATRGAGRVDVLVTDNGIGIDPEHRQHIFDMFHRVHRTANYPGTGIGLAICRRVVENHGGHIDVGEARSGGASFRFDLPAGSTDGLR